MNSVQKPAARRYVLSVNGDDYAFDGACLGSGTSFRRSHINHPPSESAPRGVRCSGCRWTTTTVYWSETDGKYIVTIVGKSVVDGERDKLRTVWAEDADAVLDALLVAPPRRFRGGDANPGLELPPPNADAIEAAAEVDDGLARVLRSWEEGDGEDRD